jgi:hypothetical protein
VRQALEELGRAAVLEPRPPVDDEVLLEAGRLDLGALDRERRPRVACDVPELLLPGPEMAGHDLVPVEAHPDTRDLGRAVAVQRHEVGERAGLDDRAGAFGKLHE